MKKINNFWKSFFRGMIQIFVFVPKDLRNPRVIKLQETFDVVGQEITKALEIYSKNEQK